MYIDTETGGLFRVAVKLMMACATANIAVYLSHLDPLHIRVLHVDRDYVPLVNLIGIYFQIRDDYMNLQSTQASSSGLVSLLAPNS